MKHLIEKASEVVDLTYRVLNLEKTDRRHDEQVQTRAAIGAALSEYMKPTHIAKAMNKDRTTVIHYNKQHDGNLKTWKGYAERYDVAKDVAKVSMHEATIKYKVMLIDARIIEYKSRINELELEKLSLV
jgi:hypothetical protein